MDHRLTDRPDTISGVDLYRYSVPLRREMHLAGRGIRRREGLLMRLRDEDGREGWGDAAPLPGFSRESLQDVTEAACRWKTAKLGAGPPSLAFAIDSALADLALPGARSQGATVRESVRVNGLVIDSDDVERRTMALLDGGYEVIKLKVGRRSVGEDVERVRRLADIIPPGVALRLDANRAWDLNSALQFVRQIEDLDIEYIEEPLQDVSCLDAFCGRTSVPIALDETLREIEPDQLAAYGFVSAVVLKPSLMGSESRYHACVRAAREIGATVVLSGAFETGVGLRSLVRLAAALTEDFACGFDPYLSLADDVIEPRISIEMGRIDVARALAPHSVLVEKLQAISC